LDDSAIALRLMLTRDELEAEELVGVLNERNTQRQAEQARIWEEVSQMLAERDLDGTNVVVLAAPGWNSGVVGIVASKVVETYNRPAVLISANELDGVGVGSARSIDSFDIGSALDECRDLLLRCGGHALAAGLSINLNNLEPFRARLNEIAGARIAPEELLPTLLVDGALCLGEVSMDLVEELKRLEPYGMGNPEPLFVTRGVTVLDKRLVGAEGSHLKLSVCADGGPPAECIAFGFGGSYDAVQVGSQIDVCYNIRPNHYGGVETAQVTVKDLVAAEDGRP
jgi:single-stranded-DNA-specific exonuclease